MLRFCANLSLLFTEVPLPERFQLASQCGFSAIEIQFPYSLEPEYLLELLSANHLKLVLFNVDADDLLQGGEGLAAVPEKTYQFQGALAQALKYAEHLKPDVINVLPGRCLNPERRQEYLHTFKQNLTLALKTFAPLRINTVFEAINHFDMPGFLINTEQHMLDMLQAIQHSNLYMQYDIYHMMRMQQNPVNFISHYGDRIGHIQFADFPGRNQPGTGSIDFKKIFASIENSAYQGWVGAEYIPTERTEASLEWLRDFLLSSGR